MSSSKDLFNDLSDPSEVAGRNFEELVEKISQNLIPKKCSNRYKVCHHEFLQ